MSANLVQQHPPRWWQRIDARISSSQIGAWLLSHTMHRMDRPVIRLSKGQRSVAGPLIGLPIVALTTRGTKSGKLHTTPLVGIAEGDNVVVIASNWGRSHNPSWYRNLRANSEVTLSMKGHTGTYVAREATGEDRERYWRRAVDVYKGYASYQQRTGGRKIPVIVLTPKKD